MGHTPLRGHGGTSGGHGEARASSPGAGREYQPAPPPCSSAPVLPPATSLVPSPTPGPITSLNTAPLQIPCQPSAAAPFPAWGQGWEWSRTSHRPRSRPRLGPQPRPYPCPHHPLSPKAMAPLPAPGEWGDNPQKYEDHHFTIFICLTLHAET